MTEPKSSDRHRKKEGGVHARPDLPDRDAAREILEARGWTMNEFLIASIRFLPENPDHYLRRLNPYRPEPVPTGRPKKAAQDQPSPRGKTRP